jgi:hypothetical protein
LNLSSSPSRLPVALWFLAGATVFALAYGQAPLYYSNQNQYFLQGLADAGEGNLAEDWLANTRDPVPIFSALVRLTASVLPPFVFHVYYALLMGVYLTCMVAIFRYLARDRDSTALRLGFVALLIVIHASSVRWASYRFLGLDYPWYFQSGVAGQYTLGAMFQPSTFGVLLIAALVFFLYERPIVGSVSIGLAITVHSTYLLPAAFFTFAAMCVLWAEGKKRLSIGVGALTLALVLPTVIFVLMVFRATSPEQFADSQYILAQVRLPHHSTPQLWLDPIAMAQIAWVVLAAALVWGTRLFWLIAIPFVLAVAMTLLQVATQSNTLALMFPWRVSAFLVPISTAVVLSRLVTATARLWERRPVQWLGAAGIVALVAGGITMMALRVGYRSNDDELEMMEFVREKKSPGDVYLLPVALQELKKTTVGSKSSDFQSLTAKKKDPRLIKVDLQRFRLHTGAAIYVDYKAMPYKDVDVLEWRVRMINTERLYESMRAGEDVKDELKRLGITHVVAKAEWDFSDLEFEEVYKDDLYRVYRVRSED